MLSICRAGLRATAQDVHALCEQLRPIHNRRSERRARRGHQALMLQAILGTISIAISPGENFDCHRLRINSVAVPFHRAGRYVRSAYFPDIAGF